MTLGLGEGHHWVCGPRPPFGVNEPAKATETCGRRPAESPPFREISPLLGRVLLTVRAEHGNLTLKFLMAHAALSSSPGNRSSSSSASCSFNLRRFSAACASSSRCQSFVGLHFLRATVGSTESAPRSRRPRRGALTAAGCYRAVCLCVCLVRRVHENEAL